MKPNKKRTLADYANRPFTIETSFHINANKKGLVLVGRKYQCFKGIPSVLKSHKFLIDEVKTQLNLSNIKFTEVTHNETRIKKYNSYFSISDSFDEVTNQITKKVFDSEQLANLVNKYLNFWNIPTEKHFSASTISLKNWNKITTNEKELK